MLSPKRTLLATLALSAVLYSNAAVHRDPPVLLTPPYAPGQVMHLGFLNDGRTLATQDSMMINLWDIERGIWLTGSGFTNGGSPHPNFSTVFLARWGERLDSNVESHVRQVRSQRTAAEGIVQSNSERPKTASRGC